MSTEIQATVEDLYHVPENGRAEIVNGELVWMAPTGGLPSRASGEIYVSLREYERRTGLIGELAEAEPALPGWSMPVDNLFA